VVPERAKKSWELDEVIDKVFVHQELGVSLQPLFRNAERQHVLKETETRVDEAIHFVCMNIRRHREQVFPVV
jgi:hypothetical protein